jgi:hypothetical protein
VTPAMPAPMTMTSAAYRIMRSCPCLLRFAGVVKITAPV